MMYRIQFRNHEASKWQSLSNSPLFPSQVAAFRYLSTSGRMDMPDIVAWGWRVREATATELRAENADGWVDISSAHRMQTLGCGCLRHASDPSTVAACAEHLVMVTA